MSGEAYGARYGVEMVGTVYGAGYGAVLLREGVDDMDVMVVREDEDDASFWRIRSLAARLPPAGLTFLAGRAALWETELTTVSLRVMDVTKRSSAEALKTFSVSK